MSKRIRPTELEKRYLGRQPNIRCGKLCLKGDRLTPLDVINMAFWSGEKEMRKEYPGVTYAQAEACWKWAWRRLEHYVEPRLPRPKKASRKS
jgi:uncharacterized protein (DUF433 family)